MFKVKENHQNEYLFVGGNTKFLRDCTQEDIKLLMDNGHRNWFVKKTEETSGGETVALPAATKAK